MDKSKEVLIDKIIKTGERVVYFPIGKNTRRRLSQLNMGTLKEIMEILTEDRPYRDLEDELLRQKLAERSDRQKFYFNELFTRLGLKAVIESISSPELSN